MGGWGCLNIQKRKRESGNGSVRYSGHWPNVFVYDSGIKKQKNGYRHYFARRCTIFPEHGLPGSVRNHLCPLSFGYIWSV